MPLIARLARRLADRPAAVPSAIAQAAAEDVAAGCGWFDSSFDLRTGLTVTEDDPGDDADFAAPAEWMRAASGRANAAVHASIR